MTASGLERARQALRSGDPEALLGERENVWLDVKSGVYRLDQPEGAEELAKDVAAFANTADGGLLVVGFSTTTEHGEEIVDALKPVPRTLIDLAKHRQIIDSRVIPALRNHSVYWIDYGTETGVLVIDIPAQPPSSQLFAVPAPTGKTTASKIALGIPIRRGDGTTWLRPNEIQHYIGLGWANSGDRIDKLVAALAAAQTTPQVEKPKSQYIVGGGEPGLSAAFQQAVTDLAGQGVMLGEPASDVSPAGPGVAQHFEVPGDPFGWVLCSQQKHRPVAVAQEIWQALRDQGSGSPDGDPLGALGLPIGDATAPRVVDRHATIVHLAGGSWGRGRLLRDPHREDPGWRWVPDPEPGTTTSASTRNWTASSTPMQLRARVLATLPWADTSDLKITPDRLEALLPALPFSRLAGFATSLSRWRGGNLPAGVWAPGPNDNTSDRFSYACEITSPEGEPALAAEVMMVLPPVAMSSAVITCAEIRVASFEAWARALGADPTADLSWSSEDLLEFFVAAWETATELLPQLAMEDLSTRRYWSAVPYVELRIGPDQQHDQSRTQLELGDVLKLERFGPSGRRGQLPDLFVSLRSAPGLDSETRRSQARSALVDMAHLYGFMQVRDSTF